MGLWTIQVEYNTEMKELIFNFDVSLGKDIYNNNTHL
jgi:hypothetical protein